MNKNFKSRYFEDYKLNQTINHSVPRTILKVMFLFIWQQQEVDLHLTIQKFLQIN